MPRPLQPPATSPWSLPSSRPPTSSGHPFSSAYAYSSYSAYPASSIQSGQPRPDRSQASSIAPFQYQRPRTPTTPTATTNVSGRRSRAASYIGANEGNQIICAVSEARGVSPSVGVAFINISTGEAVLSQICDNQSYVKTIHKLAVFEPSCILIVSTACPPCSKSVLYIIIEEELPGIRIVPLSRKYWSETAGLEYIQTLAFREDVEAIKVAIEGNFYATCSFSAVRS